MAKILVISSQVDAGLTQTVIEFPTVVYAEDAIAEIKNSVTVNTVEVIRLYNPEKGGK